MDCIKKEFVRTDADGHKWWRVVLTATEAPDSLQLTGADVDGMDDNIRFEAGSVLLTPDGNYIAFEDGNFSGEGGGGGGGDATVTLNNITGDVLNGDLFTAASLQAAMDGDYTVIQEVPTGKSTITVPVNGIIASSPDAPFAFTTTSGNVERKEEYGIVYIEVKGDGEVTIQEQV